MENSKDFLGTQPVGKLLFKLAIPTVIAQLINMLYNIVDRIFIGHIPDAGSLALTGVGVTMPIIMIVSAFAGLVSSGGAPRASISMGKSDMDSAEQTLGGCFLLQVIVSIVLTAVLLLFGENLLLAFGASENTIEYAVSYLNIYALGTLFVQLTLGMNSFVTAEGFTKVSMVSVAIGAILNIALDPIMIFGLLGFPKMGVTGAAVATVIGQCVAGIVAGTCNHKYNHEVSLSFKGFHPDISLIGHIYAVGIPSIIMQSIGSIMTYSMNRILIEFSSTATAVFGVYFKLQSFFFMPVFGLNNGITPIIAYNYGAQQRKRMIRTIRISLTTAFCLTFIGFLCFEGIPQVLLGMFNASADMLKIGVPALRIIGIHYLIAWFCIIAGTVFQALGKAVFSMIVSIMRQLVVLIPAAYILSKIGGLHVVWWSFPIAEVISFIASMAFLIRIYKTIISKIPEGKL